MPKLDERSYELIREVVRREIHRPDLPQQPRRGVVGQGVNHFVGVTDEAITARSGTTPGTGTVSLYYRDVDTGVLTDSGNDVEAYNISQTAVGSGSYVTILQDNYGSYWVIVEDCG